jgi:hypothetical protein
MIRWMPWGFLAAALFNVGGMLVHTRGFTSYPAAALIPSLFGPDGCLLIVVWGLAYAAVARHWAQLPALCAVFALEKAFYTFSWVRFWQVASLDAILHEHPGAASLLVAYGLGDGLFGLMFAVASGLGVQRRPGGSAAGG